MATFRMFLYPLLAAALMSSFAYALHSPQDFVVYAFSQCDVDGEDPQVYDLEPDVTIRAIGKWSNNGSEIEDYNFAQIARYHARNITFMGSGTASVIFPQDFPTAEVFDDMSTRDGQGILVPHDEFGFPIPARRGNLFNPAYRKYLLSWAKIQIDGGVDGINFDEVNGGFSGGQKYSFNGNEGFDDYTLADFNRYLLSKYPNFTTSDWQAKFSLQPNNTFFRSSSPEDLVHSFNYRLYLQSNNWSLNPLNSSNPLASEWGKVTANRLYVTDTSFLATYIRRYWTSLVTTLREYALSQHNRTLLISSNGLWPSVSFNSLGMYPWNPDEVTPDYRGADYVPLLTTTSPDGKSTTHLNGAKSLQSQFRYLKSLHRQIVGSGTVPLAIFIDWPNDMMAGYQGLPVEEKKDYWRIFGAEAYANGVFPAFHLRDTVGGMTASEAGVLDFMKEYAAFFRGNRGVFTKNVPWEGGKGEVKFSANGEGSRRLVGSVLVQEGGGQRTVHVVNHNYNWGVMAGVDGVVVEVDEEIVGGCPVRVVVLSPDFSLGESVVGELKCERGNVRVEIGRVMYYSVLVFVGNDA